MVYSHRNINEIKCPMENMKKGNRGNRTIFENKQIRGKWCRINSSDQESCGWKECRYLNSWFGPWIGWAWKKALKHGPKVRMNKIEMKMLFVFVFLFFLDALKIAVLNNMRWFGARTFFLGAEERKKNQNCGHSERTKAWTVRKKQH